MTFLVDREFKKWQLLICRDINIKDFESFNYRHIHEKKLNQINNDEISRQHEGNNQDENSQIGVRIAKR